MSSSAITPVNIEITNNVPTNVPTLTTGQTYSPTLVSVSGSNLGLARTQVTWRQVGNYVHIQGTLVKDANAGTGANPVGITMPSGLTIDFTQAGGTTSTDGFVVGSFGSYNILATNQYDRQLTAYVRGTGGNFANNAVYIQVPATGGTYTASQITANSIMYVNLMIPVAEWAGSGTTTLANRAVEEYAWNSDPGTAAGTNYTNSIYFGNGPAGTPLLSYNSTTNSGYSRTTYYCRFSTPIQATDKISLELSGDGGLTWNDASQFEANCFLLANSAYYGAQYLEKIDSTTVRIGFGNAGRRPDTTFGGVGTAWSTLSNHRWRVRKVSSGSQLGYPVSARNIVGDTSGTAVPTGMIGQEVVQSVVRSAATNFTNGVTRNVTASPLQLTAGVWEISANSYLETGTGVTMTQAVIGFSTSSATLPGGDTTATPDANGQIRNVWTGSINANGLGFAISPYRVNVASSLTLYPVGLLNHNGGTAFICGSFRAIRIA